MKPSDIKVGVIGYGGAFNMGKYHFDFMKQAGMVPAAVCDPDESRLAVAQEDFPGISVYTNVDDMLKNPDLSLVTIITPHNTHAEIAVKCLKAGKHVVCEKPMAITTEECDEMIEAAKANNVILSAFHNRHWDGMVLQAVKEAKAGTFGDILRVEAHMQNYGKPGDWWRSSKSISGGILYDWGVHLLEYTLQIVDSEIEEVSGFVKTGYWADQTRWKEDTNEDEGFVVVRYANGMWSTLCISSVDSNPRSGFFEITGTKGSYWSDLSNYKMVVQYEGKTWRSEGQVPEQEQWKYYQNIADHLTNGDPLIITGEWSRRPIHILDLACKSAKAGKALPAKYK